MGKATNPNNRQNIAYVYDASGTKLRQAVIASNGTVTKTTDYIGGMQYEGNTLLMKQTSFGRLRIAGSAVVYEYYIKDHPRDFGVGAPKSSNRVTFGDPNADGVADLLQEDHYYPFGLKMSDGTQTTSPPNTYRYNGKEYQDELGLAWYDSILRWGRGPVSESRMYDPSIGRWNGVDALAEKYAAWTPYNYLLGNPVVFVDPDGNSVDVSKLLEDEEGFYVLIAMMWDLTEISGLQIGMEKGKLTRHGSSGYALPFSQSAQNYVSNLIESEFTFKVQYNVGEGSTGGLDGKISLDSKQIDGLISSLDNASLNGKTQGFGMTFLHESLHSAMGASILKEGNTNPANLVSGLNDPAVSDTDDNGIPQAGEEPGAVENGINKFRTELGWPTRTVYAQTNHTAAEGVVKYTTMIYDSKEIRINPMNKGAAKVRRDAALDRIIPPYPKK